jgi:hypothetical protein
MVRGWPVGLPGCDSKVRSRRPLHTHGVLQADDDERSDGPTVPRLLPLSFSVARTSEGAGLCERWFDVGSQTGHPVRPHSEHRRQGIRLKLHAEGEPELSDAGISEGPAPEKWWFGWGGQRRHPTIPHSGHRGHLRPLKLPVGLGTELSGDGGFDLMELAALPLLEEW